jgi:phasin
MASHQHYVALHNVAMIACLSIRRSQVRSATINATSPGVFRQVTPTPLRRMHAMANPSDPFSASIIPFEVPEQMRALAEKGVSQARDSYARFKDVAETQNSTIEAVFANLSKGASAYSTKLLEIMKANATANLDFAQELVGAKTPSEALELWTTHAKKQFETFTAYSRELAELSQKVASETVEPIKNNASKLFKPAA